MPVTTIDWHHHKVRLIDQTRLPDELVYLEIAEVDDLGEAIKNLRVRGAPAIGIAAAFGVLLSVQRIKEEHGREALFLEMDRAIRYLRSTRPTAVNLGWALDRMQAVALRLREASVTEIKEALFAEAFDIHERDRVVCRALGRHGAGLLPDQATVITHCNTGALATADYGTALGVLFTAHSRGKRLHVFVDETRPLLQGARLNMWELQNEGIPCTLICDSAAAFVMQRRHIDCCLVGADRIARNGDTANKIGTYSLAVNAQRHGIPFYVAAPISTIDFSKNSGAEIPIEERAAAEVTQGFGRRTAPQGCRVYNPAFDVTPHELITAIITEAGVIRPPYIENLGKLESR
ncbi:MAG: S-methyl-5-thioribose-1-phosphate isomerase [candidate division KSB1 bacterium]|nr:S-methyl-5-thioribose-1-phosphate isomerase [candidate division KSB1 bacterium]MDZ7273269.1 S-methyl-5-thioribose-1-phosphate isomerase [candidate division KSB1 bacterium]MDZ7285371.1 S-methyl-5-thioribose-1-phosphate isomerase [candidate division KSB1 bacterium]MDZ7298403.1 S-methyl-5-thioribose-1-phosphate isomerase [candidate division KSB1 bacterium]MDZ7306481.1 S-methyl-5-thioribose-1-phosphate isomerase [candidate division KSB1 bacterium]